MHHSALTPAASLVNRLFFVCLLAGALTLLGAVKASALNASTSLVTLDTPAYIDEGIVLPGGGGVLFSTSAQLSPDDTDAQRDVYLNKDGAITYLTPDIATSVDLSLKGASDDGSKLFVESTGLLDFNFGGVDNDGSGTDVYEISGGTPKLISRFDGLSSDNQSNFMEFQGTSADGTKVFFTTDGQMNISDQDGGGDDVYQRDTVAGTTTQISTDTAGTANTGADAEYCGASASGGVVAFQTAEAMDAADTDAGEYDTYSRSGTTTSFVSTGPLGGGVAGDSSCRDVSRDGTTIAFDSKAKLFTDDDSTSKWDVFTRSGGQTRWVSTSSLSVSTIFDARYADMTADGLDVHFNTAEKLVAEDAGVDADDTDGYSSKPGGVITLETGGSLAAAEGGANTVGVSTDGNVVLFTSNDKYLESDTDEEESDLYADVAGNGRFQVSTGPADLDGAFGMNRLFANQPNHRWTMSADGRAIGFNTFARLVAADTDSDSDVYLFELKEPAVTPLPPPADTTPPAISSAKLSNKTFFIDKKVKALTAAKTKRGTKISFSLSEAASVKLAFSSVRKGKTKLVKSAKHSGVVGANSIKFGGRVGSKTLSPGKYRLKITATDAAGNVSAVKTLSFTIVKR